MADIPAMADNGKRSAYDAELNEQFDEPAYKHSKLEGTATSTIGGASDAPLNRVEPIAGDEEFLPLDPDVQAKLESLIDARVVSQHCRMVHCHQGRSVSSRDT
jgi:hypothetical protein